MTAAEWNRLADSLEYPRDAALQEAYVRTFDLDPDCSLEVGWHLFGERPERATFMATLREDLVRAGVAEDGNLPDYLPTLLRLIARHDARAASALASAIAPAASRLLVQVRAKQNPFAETLEAVVRALDASREQEEGP